MTDYWGNCLHATKIELTEQSTPQNEKNMSEKKEKKIMHIIWLNSVLQSNTKL